MQQIEIESTSDENVKTNAGAAPLRPIVRCGLDQKLLKMLVVFVAKGVKIVQTLHQTSTTEMEVTSIRLERELKERLKELAGNQGYQALIRDVLWHYIESQSNADLQPRLARNEIRASVPAVAQQEEKCVLTGKSIQPHESMLLGLTAKGGWVPLSVESLAA